jgi:ParB-like chromosome segregation protein Spo0J
VPVSCVVRDPSTEVSADEDSLAENVQRVALHPLDQFRAFQALLDKGLGEEEIAARFFVAPTVVKQRLRLAAVSEKLHAVYAEDGITLEQLMVFTVTNDHGRQEQVWEGLRVLTTTRPTLSVVSSCPQPPLPLKKKALLRRMVPRAAQTRKISGVVKNFRLGSRQRGNLWGDGNFTRPEIFQRGLAWLATE